MRRLRGIRRPEQVVLIVWMAAIAVLLWVSVSFCDAHLVYTLDDPYIHLAISENLVRGHYGINLGEHSSPASSVLFPWLLAITQFFGLGHFGPLVLNLIATAVSVLLATRFIGRAVGGSDLLTVVVRWALYASSIGLFAVALPWTGLEHSLHVMLTVVLFTGVAFADKPGPYGWRLIVSAALLPFIRFEGVAVALAFGALLAWRREWRSLAALLLMIGAGFALYAGFMRGIDLPVLPSSVTSKSAMAEAVQEGSSPGNLAQMAWGHFAQSLRRSAGLRLFIGTLFTLGLWAGLWMSVRGFRLGPLFFLGCSGAVAHLLAGSYGWFERYEVYALVMIVLCLIGGVGTVAKVSRVRIGRTALVTLAILALVTAYPYARTAWQSPTASRGIYLQHYQLHRFVTGYYPHAIAVNDVGLMSYQNDAFVLDLVGLASDQVRKLRRSESWNADVIESLLDEKEIRALIIYEDWFTGLIPEGWSLVAQLRTPESVGETTWGDVVGFFAPDGPGRTVLRRALEEFAVSLPPTLELEMHSLNSPGDR